ncbi:AraC family transcriptional regulator [Sphingosinicella sp. BN140058]|uniref:AraC family transcriptional regulator n=1 Tax=Sphingosinicella sp. BN140058 TaxID=1892855 RepID=UPI00101371D6|nr:AraC family transcriptional regulator [Sphingosinicella sp. BN140058]QAY77580.1 AraC family transcriptional regulator [Sphingosinicella sp. BN140058]
MTNSLPDKCRLQPSFWSALEATGLSPVAVLRQARLPLTLHLDTSRFVSTAQLFALWTAMAELAADPDYWLRFVEATDAVGHQPMFVAACYASDFRDGIRRIARFKQFTMPERITAEERGDEVHIAKHWLYAETAEPDLSVDISFGFMLSLGRRGTGQRLTPLRVELTRSGAPTKGQEEFFGCPIVFGCARDTLVLKASDLDRPFPGHNEELIAIITPALEDAFGRLRPRSSFSEQVKAVLKRGFASGRPEVAAVARDLGTSERTLQRRITDEGGSFRALVQEARQELGRKLLSEPSADIAEVACILGFQDITSFYRAFRSWEGVTPQAWRSRNAAIQPG